MLTKVKRKEKKMVVNSIEGIESLCSAKIGTLRRPDQVDLVASYILKINGKTSSDNTFSSDEIVSAYKKLRATYPDMIDIPDGTIITTLSQLAGNSSSNVYCAGKKRGYYYGALTTDDVPVEVSVDEMSPEKQQQVEALLEKDLYPVFTQWLSFTCDRVNDISAKRSMPKWGNPDVFGVNVSYILGQPIIEITTIEVKPDMKQWRHNIFEAVSHTLFANKVYFACICKESEFQKDRKDLLTYAQRFKIGVLVIVLDDETSVSNFTPDMIQELIPAPSSTPDTQFHKSFIESLQLYNMNDVFHFGNSNREVTDAVKIKKAETKQVAQKKEAKAVVAKGEKTKPKPKAKQAPGVDSVQPIQADKNDKA